MTGKIGIYIGRHLCTAPRAVKEADALAAAGYDVTVYGLWFDERLVARDGLLVERRRWRLKPYADCRPRRPVSRLRWLLIRAEHHLARRTFQKTARVAPDLFGYGTRQLAAHARRNPADLLVFHSEGGLWAAERLHRAGRRVGMDFEDWFSQDLAPDQRAGRPGAELARLEAAALGFGPYVLATSHAMSAALSAAYAGPAPSVIYNTFPRSEAIAGTGDRPPGSEVALHWFSQTLGPGRGLETLFAALPLLPECWSLHLRADDEFGYRHELLRRAPPRLHARIHFEPTVPNAELPARIAEHDVGLALDVSAIPSRNLTITNKLFQYLQAGLAVVASNTAGHREVLQQVPSAGQIFTAGAPDALASALRAYCENRSLLARARAAASTAAETVFAHERQVPTYSELAGRALRGS